jgi:voltage-gated potassium channel
LLYNPHPMRAFRNLKIILGALAFSAGATVGYHLIEGWSWLDSIYMVVMTITTIGYKEVHELSHAGQIFNIGVMIVGVGLVFLSTGALTQGLLEFELGKFLGKRKMQRDIERLTGHYIICGAGRVGRSVAHELAIKPVPFVVIENNEQGLHDIGDWLTLIGDATHEKTLREARVVHAAGLVAATTTDATNIYIVLTARSLNPKLKIIARASEETAEKHLRTAGADTVISPYAFAGHRIAQSFLRPNVLDFLDLATTNSGSEEMLIEEILVSPGSRFDRTTVGTSAIHRQFRSMVLAVRHASGETRFNPTAQDPINGGDFLIVMGEPAQLSELENAAAQVLQKS